MSSRSAPGLTLSELTNDGSAAAGNEIVVANMTTLLLSCGAASNGNWPRASTTDWSAAAAARPALPSAADNAAIRTPDGAKLARDIKRLFKRQPDAEWRAHIEEVAKKR